LDRAEDREGDVVALVVLVLHRRTGLASVHAAHDGGTGVEHQGGVLGTHAPGDALDDDLRVLVQVDGHMCGLCFRSLRVSSRADQALASSAALSAPPSMVSARVT